VGLAAVADIAAQFDVANRVRAALADGNDVIELEVLAGAAIDTAALVAASDLMTDGLRDRLSPQPRLLVATQLGVGAIKDGRPRTLEPVDQRDNVVRAAVGSPAVVLALIPPPRVALVGVNLDGLGQLSSVPGSGVRVAAALPDRLKQAEIPATERSRSRTDRAWGYHTAQVLKTCWATGPIPLRLGG